MTLQPQSGPAWRDWDALSWGRALLQHYFAGDDDVPVSRLSTTQEELAQAAGATAEAAADARDAFLHAIRCDPATFRRRLSDASLAPAAWDRQTPPPFLAYLFFTCFAAASLDPDIADEGVFRERLRQLLLHEEGTNYHLPDLSRLWEAFAEWLNARREVGEPYRGLILPDRGGMTLIGYSLRLAFPRRQDRLRLRELLATSDLGRAPTVPEAFQLVGKRINRFSPDFQRVFNRARGALTRSSREPLLHVIWSSIQEAAALVRDVEQQQLSRIEYQVLGQENERGRLDLFVMVSGPIASLRGDARLLRLDEAVATFEYFIAGADGTPREVSAALLAGILQYQVPDLVNSSIARAVREGVLIFSRVDSATWELALTRPREGRIRALVRSHLSTDFQRLLPADACRIMGTNFPGWQEVSEIDITDLADPQAAAIGSLTPIRCLQRVEVGSLLHLVGGIRVDGGFLGIGGLLPMVHCADADVIAISRASENSLDAPVPVETLIRDPEHEHRFLWPEEKDLDGPHLFIARREQQNAGLRRVQFYSHGLGHEYLDPTNASRWVVEASSSDVESADIGRDAFLHEDIRPANPTFVESGHGGLIVDADASIDARPQQGRLSEAIAALGMARRGVAEADLIEIFRRMLRDVDGFAVWSIIRGWLEAGYIDSLTKRAWRGRFYFPRRPRFVLISNDTDASLRVALHGLPPYRLRNAVRTLFERSGATQLPSCSLSRYVPAPLWWRFETTAHAKGAVREFGELAIKGIRDVKELAGDFDGAVSDAAPLLPGYERQTGWSFALGGFRRSQKPSTDDDVTVEYHTRPNGPDRFVVVANGERRTTLSRSWALLHGFRQANRTAFEGVGSVGVVRFGDDGPHVPLPIARALALRSGIVGGPTEVAASGECYMYAVETSHQQRWLLRWLRGEKVDEKLVSRFAWLRAAASSSRDEMRSLPADLRRKLRKLDSIPVARDLADRSVPESLVVHIRRAIALTEK